jgi:hypothetical protein
MLTKVSPTEKARRLKHDAAEDPATCIGAVLNWMSECAPIDPVSEIWHLIVSDNSQDATI